MDYTLTNEVKKIFMPHVQIKLEELGRPSALNNIESAFTQIQALGYNHGDIRSAAADIYEIQSMLQGETEIVRLEIIEGVTTAKQLFSKEVDVYSRFHKESQVGMPFDDVLKNISSRLA